VLLKVQDQARSGKLDWMDAIYNGEVKDHPCKVESMLSSDAEATKSSISADQGLAYRNGYYWSACYYPSELYWSSAYWAIVTLTSTGYGDILPVTRSETIICLLVVSTGGFAWAYMVASITAALSNLDPQNTRFRQTMDELNHFMADRGLDYGLRKRLRSFLIHSKEAMHEESVKPIFAQLSPQLAADTAFHSNEFLRNNQINFFNTCPRGFVVQITTELTAHCFAEGEKISTFSTMYILKKGIAAIEGRILTRGSVWGEDVILLGLSYVRKNIVHCLSYVETLSITRVALQSILERHPEAKRVVKKASVMLALRRAVVRSAKLLREKKWMEAHGIPLGKDQNVVAYSEKEHGMILGDIISRMSKASDEDESLPQEVLAHKTDLEVMQESVRDIQTSVDERLKHMEAKFERNQDFTRRMMFSLLEKMEIPVPEMELTLSEAINMG